MSPGAIYGIHDIFLPRDALWNGRFYNEQYLLMTYLLGGNGGDQVLLPVHWVARQPRLHGLLSLLWERADLFHEAGTSGGAYWRGAARRWHSGVRTKRLTRGEDPHQHRFPCRPQQM